MIGYILPRITKYQSVDDLIENKNKGRLPYDSEELSIEKLFQEDFVCVIGAPGIGKTRLIEEIDNHSIKKTVYHTAAYDFNFQSVPAGIEYCVIDALDEVGGGDFFSKLISIKEYKEKNPWVKVLFSCRTHYVVSYANLFSSFQNLIYVELCKLRREDVKKIIEKECGEETKDNIENYPKLNELLTIPRYLTFFLDYNEERGDCKNLCGLFDYIVKKTIQKAITSRKNDNINNDNTKIIVQRVLEKVAFIMEISRKDKISKDELYTILDGIKGNMAQMLLSNVDLLFFQNCILKETNDMLQFDNTEVQEFLAAKELCRQENIESVLYDVAVQKSLKHIYPNWYDVIPHVSYIDDKAETFINIIKLIVSYETSLDNDAFVSLLRYVDPSLLSSQQKNDLFSILLNHYLRIPTYIGWRTTILVLMLKCYSSTSTNALKISIQKFNKIVFANICAILKGIAGENKLDKELSNYWKYEAEKLIKTNNDDKKLAALDLYDAINDRTKLVTLSNKYRHFSTGVREKYCNVTGYGKFKDKAVVDCWLKSCYERNPYAINAVLNIEDPATIYYAYNKIIKSQKLYEFFNPRGVLSVHYEYYLEKQFDIVWKQDEKYKILITEVFALFVDVDSFGSHHNIYSIIKKILLYKTTGNLFVEKLGAEWQLTSILTSFDSELIDAELLYVVEKLLNKSCSQKKYVEMILCTLINKIRNDEHKMKSVSEYISRYSEIFKQWDKNTEEEKKRKESNPSLSLAYKSLSDPNKSMLVKYNTAYKLCKDIEFIKKQKSQPLVDVIESFLDEVDLDDTELKSKGNDQFSISFSLAAIPYYSRALYHMGFCNLLGKYRDLLAKSLPVACCTVAGNINEIRTIYKIIIDKFSNKEKQNLVEWWKNRQDDFLNVRPDEIMFCITEYGIDELSYKLEEYIKEFVDNQDTVNPCTAYKSLELISQEHLDWKYEDYKRLFDALKKDDIDSLKMLCNSILIKKYQDKEAIRWRINYLKNNPTKSHKHESGHAYSLSIEEAEMTSKNPQMFRCFMNIKGNWDLDNQMLGLFDFGLLLFDALDSQEYASYLLNQIYIFFINSDNSKCIAELRRKIEISNAIRMSSLANNIMTSNEMIYLKKDKITTDKAIKLYNKCIEEAYLEIRNDGDLRRFFTYIHAEVQKEIQDQGVYALVNQNVLKEDFIQRELKNTIISQCSRLGLKIQVDREVALQDNKRTDLLIRYGFCNPIMIEIKLLHNPEIQNKRQRKKYREKFIQYTNATNSCLSVFWVFKTRQNSKGYAKFKDLEEEYKNLDNTRVLLTECKCSCGVNTGSIKRR